MTLLLGGGQRIVYTDPKVIFYANNVLPARLQQGQQPPLEPNYVETYESSPFKGIRFLSWIQQHLPSTLYLSSSNYHQSYPQPGTTNYFQKRRDPSQTSLWYRLQKRISPNSETYLMAYVITLVGLPLLFGLWYWELVVLF